MATMSGDDDSNLSTLSKIRQFGLYRTVDARTEEFLKLSRRRQIKQGCACAAISTAVTVTIVIVILLIYEYAISVESSSVQRHRNNTNITGDHPVADRLDRSYFGFDQEYFEEMPLLVNAMQENSYIDPTIELSVSNKPKTPKYLNRNNPYGYATNPKLKPIRRTSPRPFIFEYRSPTPTPFSNTLTYNSRNWIESYRNAERLKNLGQVIKYLEKRINAKFGDLYTLPSNTHIAFSGLYVQPTVDFPKPQNPITTTTTVKPTADSVTQASDIVAKRKPFYAADPYFTFKPESPGDVNLLADQSLRFSPNPIQNLQSYGQSDDKKLFKIPMFRPIPQFKHGCLGTRCALQNSQNSLDKKILQALQGSSESEKIIEKPKSFSVMLNLFPLEQKRQDIATNSHSISDTIYITTSRPKLQFRPKPSFTRPTAKSRSTTYKGHHYKRPRLLAEKKLTSSSEATSSSIENISKENPSVDNTKLILHLNVYPKSKMIMSTSTLPTPTDYETTSYEIYKNHVLTTNIPPISTGDPDSYISTRSSEPFEPKSSDALLPQATTVYPFFVTIAPYNESKVWTTNKPEFKTTSQPEILKFGYEDAKVPSQYLNFGDRFPTTTQTSIRRHSTEPSDTATNRYMPSNEDMRELIVKLKNRLDSTEKSSEEITTTEPTNIETTEAPIATTTVKTYVPQINGHYRSLNQNSRNINNWLNGENEKKSRRLEISDTSTRRPYVEIQRKNSKSIEDEYD